MPGAAPVLAQVAGPGAAGDFAEAGALFADRCVTCPSRKDAPLGQRRDALD
ncbi:MAG: hypothetical protein LPJ95_11410 [Paracoccaceae bacterium]|nr:hypothetical protein [Paracoccaceae bacterium]